MLAPAEHPSAKTRTFEEHGQTWIECLQCGAQWSVHGPELEQVEEGDGYCLDNIEDLEQVTRR